MSVPTENLGLNKPDNGSDTWGDDVNENWETLDEEITDVKGELQNYKSSNMGLVEFGLPDGINTAYCFGKTN